jgi:hypothetical protein
MTDIAQRINTAEAVAAAFHAYADAIRLGQTPAPTHITLHAATLDPKTFMALADRMDARIEIREAVDDQRFPAYARIDLPFGGDILPNGIDAAMHATTSPLSEELRKDIATHNAECLDPCAGGRCIDPAAHAEGAHDF